MPAHFRCWCPNSTDAPCYQTSPREQSQKGGDKLEGIQQMETERHPRGTVGGDSLPGLSGEDGEKN